MKGKLTAPHTPSTPKRSVIVQPHKKSISKLWFKMMMTCSFPKVFTVASSENKVHSVPDHHSNSITNSNKHEEDKREELGMPLTESI